MHCILSSCLFNYVRVLLVVFLLFSPLSISLLLHIQLTWFMLFFSCLYERSYTHAFTHTGEWECKRTKTQIQNIVHVLGHTINNTTKQNKIRNEKLMKSVEKKKIELNWCRLVLGLIKTHTWSNAIAARIEISRVWAKGKSNTSNGFVVRHGQQNNFPLCSLHKRYFHPFSKPK